MATFSVDFLGCKVSHVDVHEIRERLLRDGHREQDGGGDVAVISTCCVTHEAVAKSRKAAARAARTHQRVYLTGCAANLQSDAFAGLPANVTVVAKQSEETAAFVAGDVGAIGCVNADARPDRVRAFVKIQDGCSFSCNFCVIPLVRGASRSRRADGVLREIRTRVAQGHREVVLTGINLGCFRDREAGYDLPRLVREAGETPGLARLRLSSIEPMDWDADLIALMREYGGTRLARHAHLPLQSGSDAVLRRMHRRYRPWHYAEKVAALIEAVGSDLTLGADIMVGFPGETDAEFTETIDFIRSLPFGYLHIFPFSPRPGTSGWQLHAASPVPPQAAEARISALRTLAAEKTRAHRERFLGRELAAITLNTPGAFAARNRTAALTENFLPLELDGCLPANRLVRVLPQSLTAGGSLFVLPQNGG